MFYQFSGHYFKMMTSTTRVLFFFYIKEQLISQKITKLKINYLLVKGSALLIFSVFPIFIGIKSVDIDT